MNRIPVLIFMAAVLGLSACAAFSPEPYTLKRNVSTITVKVDPMLGFQATGQNGLLPSGVLETATVVGDKCFIVIREYPVCLAHAVRHCLEGEWHPKASATFPGNTDLNSAPYPLATLSDDIAKQDFSEGGVIAYGLGDATLTGVCDLELNGTIVHVDTVVKVS